jgi:hypothetical protein
MHPPEFVHGRVGPQCVFFFNVYWQSSYMLKRLVLYGLKVTQPVNKLIRIRIHKTFGDRDK